MEKAAIMEKMKKLKNRESDHEIFDKNRPPEEFGDAVKLSLNQEDNTYRAVVFDPETLTEFSQRTLTDENEASTFIYNTLEGVRDETAIQQQESDPSDYFYIYWQ